MATRFVSPRPTGNTDTNSRVVKCPLKNPGHILVEVYEINTSTLIKDFDVSISGPSAGTKLAYRSATAFFKEVAPGAYTVTASPGARKAFEGTKTVRTVPSEKMGPTITVGPGELVRVVFRVARKIQLISADHHFVPGPEKCDITYSVIGAAGVKVLLQVFNENHTPNVIYERELTATEKANGENKKLQWDGKANCTAGPLQNKFINPLIGPCKVRLFASEIGFTSADTDSTLTRVLYHSIKLKKGSYLEDANSPPSRVYPIPQGPGGTWTNHLKWVQFRLNELGYFAGAVDGVHNPQTKRAIKRYSYEMANGVESDMPTDRFFVSSLAGVELKVPLFSDDTVIENKATKSKIFIQTNYAYRTAGMTGTDDFNEIDGHWKREIDHSDPNGGKLDRWEYPIEAEITLEAKAQAAFDPNHAGVVSKDALGEAIVVWTMTDPPEDVTIIPPRDRNSPSNGGAYISKVRQNSSGSPDPDSVGNDNCPAACGGFDRDFFTAILPQFPVNPGATNAQGISTVYQDNGTHPLLHGRTAVLFHGSHIGGDNYVVKAGIRFEGLPNQNALEADHIAFQKVPSIDKAMLAETGEMTIWRKKRVAAVVDWTDLTLPPVDWTNVVAQYRSAFTELDTSTTITAPITRFVTEPADAAPYLDSVAAWLQAADRNDMVFQPKSMLPYAFVQGKKEKRQAFENRIGNKSSNFCNSMLSRITLGSETLLRVGVGDWLAALVRRAQRPGAIVLRALPFAGVDIIKDPLIGKKKVVTPQYGRFLGTNCTGMGGGAVFISEHYRKDLKDSFLIAHEIAHTYYLSHPTQVAVDHDGADRNCTMYYLHSGQVASRGQVDMKVGSANESRFCGKCLLKLRGWKVGDLAYTVTPEKVVAIPINPVMTFEEYKMKIGKYGVDDTDPSNTAGETVDLFVGATDPKDPKPIKTVLGPLGFVHVHKLSWESSTGELNHLSGIKTRERVEYQTPTQVAPFSDAADPDQVFHQEGEPGEKGECFDDHSVSNPALIVRWPLSAGTIQAKQWYEYKWDADPFKTIGDAVFILEKTVYQDGNDWVLKFVKRNAVPDNPNPFFFEMHYKIGAKPFRLPKVTPNPLHVQGDDWKVEKGFAINRSGANKAWYTTERLQDISYEELEQLGYVADNWL